MNENEGCVVIFLIAAVLWFGACIACRSDNDELFAMIAIANALEGLDVETVSRIIDWVRNRFIAQPLLRERKGAR